MTQDHKKNPREFLAHKHQQYCEQRCFELESSPLAENDTHNRLILFERLRQLNLRGHEEAVVFACLGGELITDVAREYRITRSDVKQILAKAKRLLDKQGD